MPLAGQLLLRLVLVRLGRLVVQHVTGVLGLLVGSFGPAASG